MKSINIISLLSAIIFLCSCSKDESDFIGNDSYISSFQLKQGDITLSAAISAGSIVITAPENLSLSRAVAEIVLSENATITPNPADITDWDAPQTFTITSYNGTKSSYDYKVTRTVVSKDGDIILLTQADVEALAALGLTQINGSLTVGTATGKDSVYTLEPLTTLKTITNDLVINATYAGADLVGLESLEKVGSLQIVQAKRLKKADLPKLSAVMSNFIVNQALIMSLKCPELVRIDKGLQILNADSLAIMEFDKLQSIVENITIQGGYSVSKLKSIRLPALTRVGGNINITSLNELTAVEMPLLTGAITVSITNLSKIERLEMPRLGSLLGALSISGNAMLADMNFSSLQSIGGDCRINSLPVKNMNSLKALTSVGGELFISDMTKLTNIQGLKALTTVEGRIYLSNWPVLADETLSGFSNLSRVNGDIIISQIPFKSFYGFSLAEVGNLSIFGHGITSIEKIDVSGLTIKKKLSVSNITSQCVLKGSSVCDYDLSIDASNLNFEGFDEIKNLSYSLYANLKAHQTITAIKKVTGDLSVNIYNFESFSMPNLEEVGGKFTLSTNQGVKTVAFTKLKKTGAANLNVAILQTFALPALQSVDGNLAITTGAYGLDNLSDLQMTSLTTINGTLSLTGFSNNYFNSKLLNLDGFNVLKNVHGVIVSYNKGLVDYGGLKNALLSFPSTEWNVSSNAYDPSYQDMIDGKFTKP